MTGERQLTSHAHLTFATFHPEGERVAVPPLLLESDADRRRADEAHTRREERLRRRSERAGR
jgi:acyl-CoA hydrolase